MLGTYTQYTIITRDLDRSMTQVKSSPEVAREVEYYRANIGKVTSIDEFVGDRRLFDFAMKAFGLADMSYAKAFMTKVLEGNLDDRDSLVNTLADKRYREFATTFNFNAFGSATTAFGRAQQGVVDAYVRQTLEENAGGDNEGVRLALYFERKGAKIESAYDILGDRALGQVVRTVLGLPDSIAFLDIDRQKEMIEQRLDLEDFQDPVKLNEFVQRFTTLWDVANSQSVETQGIVALTSGSVATGISSDLMMAIQKIGR
ncbi:MAG: DUF1217 domain-containing protein [Brucellaceae bacterium]|nr:DUF1217 domain-containing protein [Brucellaceae bacterium]